jgi:uncharacterized protein (DUF433 family)
MKFGPISFDDGVLNGKPVFDGTSISVQTLIEYLEDGKSIDRFVEDYPAVNKKDVIETLQIMKRILSSQPCFQSIKTIL